uniref:Sulfatase N-terminal domain-containing protein n=1 Tax=Salarias fasciatus TaxID=181472 RepID=A0A672IZ98_SALFA
MICLHDYSLLCTCCFAESPQGNKPNIVLMMVDDLGIGDLGCYGNRTLRTPNMDRLAQEGVKLTQHIAAAPLCTPSRAAFLTGRYPIRSGMVGRSQPGVFFLAGSSGGLPAEEITFAKIAQQQGYKTALIGKWHLGLNCESSEDHCHHPSAHGFTHFFGIPLTNLRDCQPGHGTILQLHLYVPWRTPLAVLASALALHCSGLVPVSRRLALILLSVAFSLLAVVVGFISIIPQLNCVLMRGHAIEEQPFSSENLTQRMTEEAVDFIQRNSERPFLLFLSFLQVHTAIFASEAFRGTSSHGIYGDAVHEVDWSVGRIVDTLDRLQLGGNTLVYLTSDQGAHLEEVSARGEIHGGSNGIYRGGKAMNWEGGIRVPGILRWPGTIPGGREIDELTSNMDVFPTVVQLIGAELPTDRHIDGHSLMDLLQSRAETSKHEFLFHYCNAFLNAMRWKPANSSSVWKAFFFTQDWSPPGAAGCFHTHVCLCTPAYVTFHDPPLLFDLSRDPSESTPLTPLTEPTFHAVVAAMRRAVETHESSLIPVESQLSLEKLLWKPWLQPCCSSFTQLCHCEAAPVTTGRGFNP